MTRIGLRFAEADARLVPGEPRNSPSEHRSDPRAEARDAEAQTIDIGRFLLSIRRQRRAVALWMLAGLVAGLTILATTPRTYQSWATVLLDAQLNRSITEASAMEAGDVTDGMLESAVQVIRSQALASVVVDRLALHQNAAFRSPAPSGVGRLSAALRALILAPVNAVRTRLAPPAPVAPLSDAEADAEARLSATRDLQAQIKVARIGRSNALALGFTAQDPALSAAVANAYAESYVADLLNANMQATELTTTWMQTRLQELEGASREAALAAERFRAANGLVRSDGGLMTEQNVSRLNSDLIDATADAARARALVQSLDAALAEAAGRSDLAGTLTLGGADDPRLTSLQDELSALQLRLERVVRDHGGAHPQAARLRDEMDELGRRILIELARRADAARADATVADARVAALREGLGLAVDTSTATGPAMVELRALEQRARTLAALYETSLARLAVIDQQKSFPVTDVRILSAAEPPTDHIGPRTTPTLAVALVLGALAGLVHAMVREWRDRFLRTAADVIDGTGQRFLGYLPTTPQVAQSAPPPPRITAMPRDSEPAPMFASRHLAALPAARAVRDAPSLPAILARLPVQQDPNSLFAETLRNIRLALDLDLPGPGARVIGLTSLRPGEGKTTVALNLAGVLASGTDETALPRPTPEGSRGPASSVLLIDADPRSPGLTRSLMPDPQRSRGAAPAPGLIDVVTGRVPWTSALHPIAGTGIDFLGTRPTTAGPRQAGPRGFGLTASAILGSPRMAEIIAEARASYGYVVIDLSPLGPLVDARVLIPHLDRVALVAEWGKLPKRLMDDALAAEPLLAARLLGVLLNKVDMKALKSYAGSAGPEQYFDEYRDYLVPGAPRGA